MLIIFCTIGLIIQLGVYLEPYHHVSEVIISFLPYLIGINFVLSILSIYKTFSHRHKYISCSIRFIISASSLISLGGYTDKYYQIYYNTHTKYSKNEELIGLKYFYANIYYQNKNLSGLIDIIEKEKPDIVLLVEYTKEHNEILSPLLTSQYPYISRYIGGQGYDGDVIYSRYPLTKIKHEIYPGSFSHVSIKYKKQSVNFALIHTSAPISKKFFDMRNKQLNDLGDLMSNYYNQKNEQKIILIGDFNITPRSSYYKPFDVSMISLGLSNISTDITSTQYDNILLPYTRCHNNASYMCSHIDHIRSNIYTQAKKVQILGSDHDGFVGEI